MSIVMCLTVNEHKQVQGDQAHKQCYPDYTTVFAGSSCVCSVPHYYFSCALCIYVCYKICYKMTEAGIE